MKPKSGVLSVVTTVAVCYGCAISPRPLGED